MGIISGLQNLDKDIVEGVESNFVGKIPGWKKALVSFYGKCIRFYINYFKF
jgi:hypothetical protein